MKNISCNVCGSDHNKLLYKSKDRLHRTDETVFDVNQCLDCSLVFLNPQPTPEELEKFYPKAYGPYQNSNQILKYGLLSMTLKKFLIFFQSNTIPNHIRKKENKPQETEVLNYLDFGCGGGAQLEDMRAQHPNWNFYGLDNNDFACEQARNKGFKIFCGDILNMNLPENFFDVVNMSHIIEHVHDPKAVLKRIYATMKPDAKLIVSTPNFNSLAAKIFRSYWYALDTPRHLFLFSQKNLSQLLHDCGFVIKKIEFDPGPKAALRSFYYLLGRRDMSISPIVWRLFQPLSNALSFFGQTSIMTVRAQKQLQ